MERLEEILEAIGLHEAELRNYVKTSIEYFKRNLAKVKALRDLLAETTLLLTRELGEPPTTLSLFTMAGEHTLTLKVERRGGGEYKVDYIIQQVEHNNRRTILEATVTVARSTGRVSTVSLKLGTRDFKKIVLVLSKLLMFTP